VQQINASTDGTGVIQKTALTTGSADTVKNLNKILVLRVGQIPYKEVHFSDHGGFLSQPYRCYYEYGDQYNVFPVSANTAFEAVVNFLPCPQHQLATESSIFTFPEGFEDVPLLEAAAELLGKGGAEVSAAQAMQIRAAKKRDDMYSSLGRGTLNPIQWKYADSAQDWGG
jgi:hypothetical protein